MSPSNPNETGDENASDITTDDLREELEIALDEVLEFKGSLSYGMPEPDAPNPCLNIEGLGLIGLPLSTRDAGSIIECSTEAPFGHTDHMIVDADVRKTWEIEATRVRFDNPAWDSFIKTRVISSVQDALGVSADSFQCILHKLLLYETGAHFLPHQDTEKTPSMFATVTVVLPSPYTGGQVHVSHAPTADVLDMSSTSLLLTSVLAWYTGVTLEVKPITSGYRLALSYNLIHTSPSVPRPVLPDLHGALAKLSPVLRKWHNNAYEFDRKMVVYPLAYQYEKALKNVDGPSIANLRIVAEDLGYKICLANLAYNICGFSDEEYGYSHGYKRRRHSLSDGSDDSDDGETSSMGGEDYRNITLKDMVDLEGNSILDPHEFSIQEHELVSDNPFEGVEPDNKERGYRGVGNGSLDYWYHRAALVLIHKDDAAQVFFSLGGVNYALSELKRSTSGTPTADNRTMAKLILDHSKSFDKTTAVTMADYSIEWEDLEMWKTVIRMSGSLLSTFGTLNLVKAWKAFSFEGVRVSFEEMLLKSTRLSERLSFIQDLPLHTSPANREEHKSIENWSQEQYKQALSMFNAPALEDIATLIEIAHTRGVSVLLTEILPQLARNTSVFTFCVAFAKSLHEHKKTILERPGSVNALILEGQKKESEDFDSVIEQCLDISAMQWESVVAQPSIPSRYPHTDLQITRIIDVVEACLLTGHMGPCRKMFSVILKAPGTAAKNFQTLYGPLIPRLRSLLQTHDVDICSSPFSEFLQLLVGTYMRDVLGARPQNAVATIRRMGCGCEDCNAVDNFMNSQVTQKIFRYTQKRRLHTEQQVTRASDLVTSRTLRSGEGVEITKRPKVVATLQWSFCVVKARTFLDTIGNDDVLSNLMGNRYDDVMKALQGTQSFILTAGGAATATSVSPPAPNVSHTLPTLEANTAPTTAPTAGKKRKKSAR